jgi:hypothetical protein
VRFVLDAVLIEERARYRLEQSCERCVLFDPEGEGSCVHGYPSERFREATLREPGREIYFCNEFSLV